jgi:hypothetical protein
LVSGDANQRAGTKTFLILHTRVRLFSAQ